jgi:hypothetical protein
MMFDDETYNALVPRNDLDDTLSMWHAGHGEGLLESVEREYQEFKSRVEKLIANKRIRK